MLDLLCTSSVVLIVSLPWTYATGKCVFRMLSVEDFLDIVLQHYETIEFSLFMKKCVVGNAHIERHA